MSLALPPRPRRARGGHLAGDDSIPFGGQRRDAGMRARRLGTTVAEILVWQVSLSALWLVLISTVDPLKLFVGLGCTLAGAVAVAGAAVAARRVVPATGSPVPAFPSATSPAPAVPITTSAVPPLPTAASPAPVRLTTPSPTPAVPSATAAPVPPP
ncbi:hypothetical protein [Streptomyces aureus]|uniref:hypothetical protein n=1 Tax=Streptomyces aureus TaxID=193461 RepID=UPI00131AE3A6|nr:hypothetical protein [Streptomyces aureus]